MKKKVLSILLITLLIGTMTSSTFAGNGDNWGNDTFGANIAFGTISGENQGLYTVGEYFEFKTSTYCSDAYGMQGTRTVIVSVVVGESDSVSDLQYLDTDEWKDISGYNTEISFKNDISRNFRVRFEKEGIYLIKHSFVSADNTLGVSCVPRYITIKDGMFTISKNEPEIEETTEEQTTLEELSSEVTTKVEETEVTTKIEETEVTTTKAQIKIDVAKVQIKKIIKKKSAKSIKINIKKIKDASGYYIRIYNTIKNAKKDKKALVKKIVKKNVGTFTISRKTLKNRKTIFVKVRAYKKIKGKTYYGKWSKIESVKSK